MVLVQKQTHRSMEQDRKPRNQPDTYYQLTYDEGGKNTKWKKSLFYKWC